MTEQQRPSLRLQRFIAARLDPKASLGLHLTAAVLVGAAALWTFSALLDAVLDNATLVRWDIAAATWVRGHVTPGGLVFFDGVTRAGSPESMAIVSTIACVVLWRQRRRRSVVVWVAAYVGGAVLEHVLKSAVHRTRPIHNAAYSHGDSFSFPSGHSMMSLIGLGMLSYTLGLYWRPPHWARRVALLLASAMVVMVGVSRIYLGVHYPSDVIGGYAAAAGWMAVCVSAGAIVPRRDEQVSSS